MNIGMDLESGIFNSYKIDPAHFDEVWNQNGDMRPHYRRLMETYKRLDLEEYHKLNELAKVNFFNQGVTFNVYSEKAEGVERIFPFDLFPRIIPAEEWSIIEKGIKQRNQAINLFLWDIYHDKKILKDKVVPAELLFTSTCKTFNYYWLHR